MEFLLMPRCHKLTNAYISIYTRLAIFLSRIKPNLLCMRLMKK